jgi:hypothetical protein
MFSETSVFINQSTRRHHNPEDNYRHLMFRFNITLSSMSVFQCSLFQYVSSLIFCKHIALLHASYLSVSFKRYLSVI